LFTIDQEVGLLERLTGWLLRLLVRGGELGRREVGSRDYSLG